MKISQTGKPLIPSVATLGVIKNKKHIREVIKKAPKGATYDKDGYTVYCYYPTYCLDA